MVDERGDHDHCLRMLVSQGTFSFGACTSPDFMSMFVFEVSSCCTKIIPTPTNAIPAHHVKGTSSPNNTFPTIPDVAKLKAVFTPAGSSDDGLNANALENVSHINTLDTISRATKTTWMFSSNIHP
eukprot:m.12800 g.12800  ORF g.12800 m.12800 type:complete len:126 (-) comp9456_c1_seq1:293-670(-)